MTFRQLVLYLKGILEEPPSSQHTYRLKTFETLVAQVEMSPDTNKESLPHPQWVIDLNTRPTPKPKAANIPDPPGYSPATTTTKVR